MKRGIHGLRDYRAKIHKEERNIDEHWRLYKDGLEHKRFGTSETLEDTINLLNEICGYVMKLERYYSYAKQEQDNED